MANCGQVVIPTTDETELPCDKFTSGKCIIYEEALAYLRLGVNSTYNQVIDNLLLSLIDARNRINSLESNQGNQVKVTSDINYTLVSSDAKNIVTSSGDFITIPVDVDLDFNIGTEIVIVNLGNTYLTLQGAGITFIENTGLTLPVNSSRTLIKLSSNTWLVKN